MPPTTAPVGKPAEDDTRGTVVVIVVANGDSFVVIKVEYDVVADVAVVIVVIVDIIVVDIDVIARVDDADVVVDDDAVLVIVVVDNADVFVDDVVALNIVGATIGHDKL